jgi:hypothetical protein
MDGDENKAAIFAPSIWQQKKRKRKKKKKNKKDSPSW